MGMTIDDPKFKRCIKAALDEGHVETLRALIGPHVEDAPSEDKPLPPEE